VLLLDSAHLQEEDARRANRYGYSRHEKALPLYTRADAKRALALHGAAARARRGAWATTCAHAGRAPAGRLRGDAVGQGHERWCSRATWAAATTC
jgi:metallo-beta-lactamase family protein